MPYVADVNKAKTLEGQLIGNGQCVTFVHAIVTTPPSSLWHQGASVKGNKMLGPALLSPRLIPMAAMEIT